MNRHTRRQFIASVGAGAILPGAIMAKGSHRVAGLSKRSRAARVQKAREASAEGFRVFCELVFKDDKHRAITIATHQEEWIHFLFDEFDWDWLQGKKDTFDGVHKTILAHVKSGKSPLIAVAMPLWLWGVGRTSLRMCAVCNVEGLAFKRVRAVGQYIQDDDDYHEVFPQVQQAPGMPWNNHTINIARDAGALDFSYEAYGVTAQSTGLTVDIIIGDDIVDLKDRQEPNTKAAKIDLFNHMWMTRLAPGGGCNINIGTRWAKDDLWEHLIKTKQVNNRFLIQGVSNDVTHVDQPPDYYTTPAFASVVQDAREPKKIPLWSLAPKRVILEKAQDPVTFACCMRQVAFTEEDRLFDQAAIDRMYRWDITWRDMLPVDGQGRPAVPTVMGVDLSGEGRKGTIMFSAAIAPDGRIVVVDILRGNFGAGVGFVERLYREWREYDHVKINIESTGLQNEVVRTAQRLYARMPVQAFLTGKNKSDPEIGIPMLAGQINRGLWVVPAKDIADHQSQTRCECGKCTFRRELQGWPSLSSDVVMSCWMASSVLDVADISEEPDIVHVNRRGRENESTWHAPQQGNYFGHGYGFGNQRARVF